jgi:hypothetical protein
MFNMGGPIKQGIMNGIREPKRDGGKMLLAGQHPQQFKDAGGREQHAWPLLYYGAQALRALPMVWRGMKTARTLNPALKGWSKWKNILPSSRFRNTPGKIKGGYSQYGTAAETTPSYTTIPGEKLGFWKSMADPKRFGAAIRENPITALSSLTLPAQAIDLGREHGKDIGKGALNLVKRFGAAVVPGDQSDWYTDPVTHDTVSGVPGGGDPGMYYDKTKKVPKKLSEAERKAFALKQREGRVQKYLDLMGYDRSKKTAIADALIDASKIVGDRGSLDPKNITQELINPIIQATSKRLDKPDQIREAVGLMATKAEIEKDLSAETDALAKTKTVKQIEVLNRQLEQGFESDIRNLLLTARTPPNKAQLEQYARLTADKYGDTFTVVEDASVIADKPGVYMLEDKIFRVDENGVSKQIV